MRILNIESTCDETAISITETNGSGWTGTQFSKIKILGDTLNSQAALHAEFGGVYPSLAKREHIKNLVPALEFALAQARMLYRISPEQKIAKEKIAELAKILEREKELFARLVLFFAQYGKPNIDAISIVSGPGLAPALWVGVNFARALAKAWDLPILELNHMEGHIYSSFFPDFDVDNAIKNEEEITLNKIQYPALALLLSGGHTEIVYIKEPLNYKKLGQTLDDAVGEAYDKVARLLGLSYPGGPEISRLSDNFEKSGRKKPEDIKLPRPKIQDDDLDFSFSGLKTAVLRLAQKLEEENRLEKEKETVAYEFELAVQDVILSKLKKAVDTLDEPAKSLLFAGGVSANRRLRDTLEEFANENSLSFLRPPLKLSGDNALMSALAAHQRLKVLDSKAYRNLEKIEARSNWALGED